MNPASLVTRLIDAAAAAAAEDHRVGALQRLHAFEVVEIAIILDVVAHAVDEEVGGRAVAADDDLVAVVLALVSGDAGHVAHDVADAHHHLVLVSAPGCTTVTDCGTSRNGVSVLVPLPMAATSIDRPTR